MDGVNDRAWSGHSKRRIRSRRSRGGPASWGASRPSRSATRACRVAGLGARARQRTVWAIEDCRHVSGSFERFLIARGERVLRVTTKLMADARRRSRAREVRQHRRDRGRTGGPSGGPGRPAGGATGGPELDLRLLVDHRERLVRQRVALNNTLQWHLHDLWPELRPPGSSLFDGNWSPASPDGSRALSRRCASASPVTSCVASESSRRR